MSPDKSVSRERRFVDRIYRMRMLGLVLAALPIMVILRERGAPAWTWAILAANVLVWPHVARRLARNSPEPVRAEFRNLATDSVASGVWVAIIGFNLVPSALLLAMLTVDKISVAGWRLLSRTTPLQLLACGLVWTLLGFPLHVHSSVPVIVASLPFMLGFPLALASLTRRLGHQVAVQNRQLQWLNRSDALTGLPNRRHWNESLGVELARYQRTRRPSVLMLLDLDHFKEVNDHHGHLAGDEVLRCIAEVLRACTRDIDTPARLGGDEFGALIAETNLRAARDVAERIRTTFLAARPPQAAAHDCTLSIGLSEIDQLVVAPEDWMQRADAAMYRAKAEGRNRVADDREEAAKRRYVP